MFDKYIQDLSEFCNDNTVYQKARKIAAWDKMTVLITGETGTGKDILAHHIHYNSPRAEKPFIAVNAAILKGSLIRSSLFGHKKGSFSDAHEDNNGFIKEANGGTIFLDEIGDIDSDMQVILLKFLDSGEIMPVGANKPEKYNVRVIVATNANLRNKIATGEFRVDLYQRLCRSELHLNSLRIQPKHEIRKSVEYHIHNIAEENKKVTIQLTECAWDTLLNYKFPGNYREVSNIVNKLYIEEKNIIDAEDIQKLITPYDSITDDVHESITSVSTCNRPLTFEEHKSMIVFNTVKRHNGVKKYAAEELRIDDKTLDKYLKAYDSIGKIPDAVGINPIGDRKKRNSDFFKQ